MLLDQARDEDAARWPAATQREQAAAEQTFAALWRDDPQRAVTLLGTLASSGEFTAAEILDEAADTVALTGLLVLHEVPSATDPSTAAELCLSAVPHFALAVTLASADL